LEEGCEDAAVTAVFGDGVGSGVPHSRMAMRRGREGIFRRDRRNEMRLRGDIKDTERTLGKDPRAEE